MLLEHDIADLMPAEKPRRSRQSLEFVSFDVELDEIHTRDIDQRFVEPHAFYLDSAFD